LESPFSQLEPGREMPVRAAIALAGQAGAPNYIQGIWSSSQKKRLRTADLG